MELTAEQRTIIEAVVNVFETGKADGEYGRVTILPDGPHGQRQVTYGRSQVTEHGDGMDLSWLIERYVQSSGTYATDLMPYIHRIGDPALCKDETFLRILERAGADPIMRAAQDELFDNAYFRPAMGWCDEHGLALPLSALAVYDSWIHSGGILRMIRRDFPEAPPSAGGEERAWTSAYVSARARWLAAHPKHVVRRTLYRMSFLRQVIDRGDWHLADRPFFCRRVRLA